MATNLGNHVFTPDAPSGLASAAATRVSAMQTAGVHFVEESQINSQDTDVINYLVDNGGAGGLLLRFYRSLEAQRLFANFSFHMEFDGTNYVLKCHPRSLAKTASLQTAMENCGIPCSGWPSEDWSGTGMTTYLTTLNGVLKAAPYYTQIYRA